MSIINIFDSDEKLLRYLTIPISIKTFDGSENKEDVK
jgi:hypothetical protein